MPVICCLLLGACLAPTRVDYPDWRQQEIVAPAAVGVAVDVLDEHRCDIARLQHLVAGERLLLVVPGVDADRLPELVELTEALRVQGGYRRAMVFDWFAEHFGRGIMLAATTSEAAERLADRCRAMLELRNGLQIDVFAHSGGSVVINKAARALAETSSPLRFGHVLLCGTPIKAESDLSALMSRCRVVVNVHSIHDAVNRSLSDELHGLCDLEAPHANLRMDHSLGMVPMRHDVYLRRSPDLVRHFGSFLRDGHFPRGAELAPSSNDLDAVHAQLVAMRAGAAWHAERVRRAALRLLRSGSQEEQGYGVLLANASADRSLWPSIRELLRRPDSSPWLRRQIYRYLVSIADGSLIDVLRYARKRDPHNRQAVYDALIELDHADVDRLGFDEPGATSYEPPIETRLYPDD